MEEIRSADDKVVAIVIRKDFKSNGINFVSKIDYPLQVGVNGYQKGSKIKPHIHIDREITVKTLQEIIYIRDGAVKVDLYDQNKRFFQSLKLSAGDVIFFVSGGHGFEILDDTTIVEVKQGPYIGKQQDKVMME